MLFGTKNSYNIFDAIRSVFLHPAALHTPILHFGRSKSLR